MNKNIQCFTSNNNIINKYKSLCSKLFHFNKETTSYQSKLIQIIPNKSNPYIIINPKGFKLYDRKVFQDLLFEVLSLYRFITPNTREFENDLRALLESINETSYNIRNELDKIITD